MRRPTSRPWITILSKISSKVSKAREVYLDQSVISPEDCNLDGLYRGTNREQMVMMSRCLPILPDQGLMFDCPRV